MWEILLESPFGIANVMLFVINAVIAIYYLAKLMTPQSPERLVAAGFGINIILFICFCTVFFTFVDSFYKIFRASQSIAQAGTGDPRVFSAGMIEFMFSFMFYLTCGSFFLIVWFLLKAFHRFKTLRYNSPPDPLS